MAVPGFGCPCARPWLRPPFAACSLDTYRNHQEDGCPWLRPLWLSLASPALAVPGFGPWLRRGGNLSRGIIGVNRQYRAPLMSTAIEHITMQLAKLPPERLEEVVDFVDFIATREQERRLVRAAQVVSEAALETLWSNETDAAYDRL